MSDRMLRTNTSFDSCEIAKGRFQVSAVLESCIRRQERAWQRWMTSHAETWFPKSGRLSEFLG
jgi:hypothetical protein